MEAESVQSLTPLMQAADQWGEVLLLLPLLLVLEAVLSADNAIALAAISRRLHDPARQRRALNLGLALALVFRLLLIVLAQWVLHVRWLQMLAAAYLLWICLSQLLGAQAGPEAGPEAAPALPASDSVAPVSASAEPQPGPWAGVASVVATLALTDLAFSLDSVAAAVAVSDRLWLVMAGGVIGVIALRLTAELFIRWLEVFRHLEAAGYLAVGLVGLRLLLRVLLPAVELPEWSLLLAVSLLFAWGFSARKAPNGMGGG
ncbi:MAG: TerC family protein [Prochlorococcaceae cyanobacterium]